MIFQSLHFTGKSPFKEVVIHGLIRDEQGRKMSKSLGNGVDPIDVIEKYGVDALRYFITTNSTPGLDMRYSDEKLSAAANYLNKIWNSARYVEMSLGDDFVPEQLDRKKLGTLEKYILSRLNKTIASVTAKMEKYQFGAASSVLYDFVYDDFCSFYLEMSKVSLEKSADKAMIKTVLYKVIEAIVKMIYPYCPFIAEEIYLSLPLHKESIMLESYPEYDKSLSFPSAERQGELLKKMIKDGRSYKSEAGLAPNAPIEVDIAPKAPFKGIEDYLSRFLFASKVVVAKEIKSLSAYTYSGFVIAFTSAEPKPEQVAKLRKKEQALLSEIARGEKMLSNPGFLAKAPKAKVELEQGKLEDNRKQLQEVRKLLESLA